MAGTTKLPSLVHRHAPRMWVTLSAAIAVLIIGVLMARRAAVRLGNQTLQRLPVGSDGLIPGAAGFELSRSGDSPAVLLLHGGGDTPQTLRYLADHLHGLGYHVLVPLLPGHGRTLRDFSTVTAAAWMETARSAYHQLTSKHRWVAVAGLSMGGALAARLAAEEHSVPAIVLLAPYFAMPRSIAIAARLSWLWGPAAPFVNATDPTGPRSIQDEAEAARSLGYGVFTPSALRALHTTVTNAIAALPNVIAPTLMIQSRQDNRVPPDAAQRAFDRIGSTDKALVWLTGAGHVITVDYGRDRVFQLVAEFLDRHRVASTRERRA